MNHLFSAVILSAGFSSRMPDFKPLLPIDGIPAIGRLIKEFYDAGLQEIIVVVGYRHEEIEAYLTSLPRAICQTLKIKQNPIFVEGMYSSIQAGIAEISPGQKGFFVLPVDYPLVQKSVFEKLIYYWQTIKRPASKVLYPTFGERRGHPPLLATEFIPEIITKEQEMGLRSFLRCYQHLAEHVPVEEETILWDMDRKEDVLRLTKIYEKLTDKPISKQSVIL